MIKPPTDSQWEAIRTTDRHLLVAAGAGTGKTHTVVGKILYLLGVPVRDAVHAPRLQLRDIAAITYTNRAAADLKDKLRTALRAAGRVAESYEVDNARIGTIHGFCGDILREFALRSGRSPASGVLSEGEGAALADEAVTDAIVAALEENAVAGLDELFATWSVSDVRGWVAQLASDSDRLEHLAMGYDELGGRERTLVDLARRAVTLGAERLEARQAMDFDRMITWTRDLIRDDPSVQRALQRRLRVLIVDEFQDVDPVQKEIAYLLGEPGSGRADSTRLMLVGDPKQSIYRFRRADVTVWRHVERDFVERGYGAAVTLADNFRSVAPVLAMVEHTVGRVLNSAIDGDSLRSYEVPFSPVRATRTDGPADRAVELLLVPPKDDGCTRPADEVRAIEAESVARRMRELHAEGVEWREMAVLLTGWGAADIYEGALERGGIPTYTLRNSGFYDRPEVIDMIVALEAVRDPRDDRALVGFLRGPFVGVRDETLLGIARGCGQPYWDHLASCDVAERALLERGRALLGRYAATRDRVPTVDLLRGLLEESGYLAHLALMGGDGDRPLANVRQFLRMAAAAPELGVGELLRLVRETREREDRVGEARLHGERDQVVTITTVHSAKGLEWKVVFWCDLVRGRRVDHPKLLIGRERLELGDDVKGEAQPETWKELKAEMDREEVAEQKRLWYVAATRAADRLVLSGIPQGRFKGNSGKGCPAAELKRLLPTIEEADVETVRYPGSNGVIFQAVVRHADASDVSESGEAVEGPVLSAASLELPPDPIQAPLGRGRHSATEFLAFTRCQRRHWFKYTAGLREPAVDRSGPEFGNAIARGLIVHDVLEHLREEADVDRLLEEAIGRHDEDAPEADGIEGRTYRDDLRGEVERVATSPDYRAIADLQTARRELGFLHLAGRGAVVEGKIDLAAAHADGVVVLDVKTNRGDDDAVRRKAETYAAQRDAYVDAVEAVSGLDVTRFAFHFSGPGIQISQAITPELRAGAQLHVSQLAAGIGAGSRELTTFPEECRFCGYKRVGWCPGAADVS